VCSCSCNFVSLRVENKLQSTLSLNGNLRRMRLMSRGEKQQISKEWRQKVIRNFGVQLYFCIFNWLGHGWKFRQMTKKKVVRNFSRWNIFFLKVEVRNFCSLCSCKLCLKYALVSHKDHSNLLSSLLWLPLSGSFTGLDLSKILGGGPNKILGGKKAAITDESLGVYQLLGVRARAAPKVYAYEILYWLVILQRTHYRI